MNKNEFLSLLSDGLSGRMTAGEINEHINFYSEAIDDRIEEGLSEDAAVLDIHDAAGRIIEPNSFNGFHENGCAREKFISGNAFTVYDKAVCAEVITDIGNTIG